MIELTQEQRMALQNADASPVRVVNPETNDTYVLLREELYEGLRSALRSDKGLSIPPEVRACQEMFWKELPVLLKDKKHGKWVAYARGERVGMAPTRSELILECGRRGLKREECFLAVVRPVALPPWEPEEVEGTLYEFTDESVP